MVRQELNKRSPIRILEKSTQGGLGKQNVGVFIAEHGEGKTACLVYFSLDALLQGKKVLHLSYSEKPDHILSRYEAIFQELSTRQRLEMAAEIHDEITKNRMVLNFKKGLDFTDMTEKMVSAMDNLNFEPDMIVVDGYDFENASEQDFYDFNSLAEELDVELWLGYAATHSTDIAAKKVPEPLLAVQNTFAVMIMLEAKDKAVTLTLLKDHERGCVEDTHLRLDPTSLLIINE